MVQFVLTFGPILLLCSRPNLDGFFRPFSVFFIFPPPEEAGLGRAQRLPWLSPILLFPQLPVASLGFILRNK